MRKNNLGSKKRAHTQDEPRLSKSVVGDDYNVDDGNFLYFSL